MVFFLLHLLFPALRWQLGDLCLLECCWWRRRGWLCWWWCCQGRPSPAPRLLTLPHFAFTSHFYASLTTYSVIARFLVLVHDPQHSWLRQILYALALAIWWSNLTLTNLLVQNCLMDCCEVLPNIVSLLLYLVLSSALVVYYYYLTDTVTAFVIHLTLKSGIQ